MNLGSLQDSIRPHRQSTLHALIPIFTVLISGLVIILAVSPQYLRQLHPLTLLLLAIACALPVWAWNQLLWWYSGRSVSAAIVEKLTYVLDVPQKHRRAYGIALSQLLKAVDVLRFLPHENIANFVTVIAIYAGAAVCYWAGASPAVLCLCIFGLSVFFWAAALIFLRRSLRKIDVKPLRELWHELKNRDELFADIGRHFERMEKTLLANLARRETSGESSAAGENSG